MLLSSRLENELGEDFPGWLISREPGGRWVATRPEWGSLYERTASDLRERMRRHIRGAADV
jgi:hypothetical protein